MKSLIRADAESACRPGSVTPLFVTWPNSAKCWLTCGFTSHSFSSVPGSFHALAEQRRNWQILSRVWADEEARAVLERASASWRSFRHARSSRTAILREEETGPHGDGSITWEGRVTRSDGSVEES